MRLNLSHAVERYQLIAPTDEFAGVAITARPALTEVIEEAKGHDDLISFVDELRELVEAEGEGGEVTPEMIRAKGRSGLIFAKIVARMVIESWEGIEAEDGSPAPVTDQYVNAFLDHPALYDRFTAVYLSRWLSVQLEKNVSAPSPNGTSAGEETTAAPAPESAPSARAKSTPPKR